MADEIAKLGIEIDSSDTIRATKELDRLENQSGKTERATKGVTKSTKTSGAAMATYAISVTAVAATLVKIVGVHAKFGEAIQDLSAITGATGKDLEFYKEQALAIGEATTLSATQAAIAFKLIASAKPDLLESKEALAAVTQEAVTLAEAASIDMPAAAEALGSSLNQFGAGAESASRFINVLAAGAKFGASEIRDTSVALREAGTVSSAAGLSFETTNAAIQTLAGVAIKGSKAGTALRNILVNLQTQSDDSINPAVVGLSTALKNLGDQNLDTAELTKLFGKEQLASAQALIKNGAQVADLEIKLKGTTTAYDQARVKVNSLAGDQKKLDSAWEGAALTVGSVLNPALRGATQFVTDLAKPVQAMVIQFEDFVDSAAALAAGLAALLSGDLAGMEAIKKAREEQAIAVQEQLDKLWEKAGATDLVKQKEEEQHKAKMAAIAAEKEAAATKGGGSGGGGATEDGLNTASGASDMELGVDITAIQNSLMTKTQMLTENREAEKLLIEQWLSEDFAREAEANALLLELDAQYELDKTAIAQKATDDRRKLLSAEVGAAANILSGLSNLMKTEGKKQSATQKILAKASIIASTAQAVMNALAVPPYPLGVSLAVGAALQGANQLKTIGAGGGGGAAPPSLQSPAGFPQDSLASGLSSNAPASERTTPSNVLINIEGVVDRDAAEKIAEEMRELFEDGGRGLTE